MTSVIPWKKPTTKSYYPPFVSCFISPLSRDNLFAKLHETPTIPVIKQLIIPQTPFRSNPKWLHLCGHQIFHIGGEQDTKGAQEPGKFAPAFRRKSTTHVHFTRQHKGNLSGYGSIFLVGFI